MLPGSENQDKFIENILKYYKISLPTYLMLKVGIEGKKKHK